MIWYRDEISSDRGTEFIGSYSYLIEDEDKEQIASDIVEELIMGSDLEDIFYWNVINSITDEQVEIEIKTKDFKKEIANKLLAHYNLL